MTVCGFWLSVLGITNLKLTKSMFSPVTSRICRKPAHTTASPLCFPCKKVAIYPNKVVALNATDTSLQLPWHMLLFAINESHTFLINWSSEY